MFFPVVVLASIRVSQRGVYATLGGAGVGTNWVHMGQNGNIQSVISRFYSRS
jgi:hypothetical protein